MGSAWFCDETTHLIELWDAILLIVLELPMVNSQTEVIHPQT